MRAVGAAEARSKFAQLLDQVGEGQEIVITRRGQPVARLIAAAPGIDREKARRAVAGILATSKGLTLGGLRIKDLVDEGRP